MTRWISVVGVGALGWSAVACSAEPSDDAMGAGGTPGVGGVVGAGGVATGGAAAGGSATGGSVGAGGVVGAGGAATGGAAAGGSASGGGVGAGGAAVGGAAAGGAGTGGVTGDGGSATGGAAGVAFEEVQAALATNCTPCHDTAMGSKPKLVYSSPADAATLYTTLTTATSAACGGDKLVTPNDAANSALIAITSDAGCGTNPNVVHMPKDCPAPCTETADAVVLWTEWINSGAPGP